MLALIDFTSLYYWDPTSETRRTMTGTQVEDLEETTWTWGDVF